MGWAAVDRDCQTEDGHGRNEKQRQAAPISGEQKGTNSDNLKGKRMAAIERSHVYRDDRNAFRNALEEYKI